MPVYVFEMNDIDGTQLHSVEAVRTSGFAASSSSEVQPADVSTADVARNQGAADQTGEDAFTVPSSTMAVVRAFIDHVTTTCLQDFPPTFFMCGVIEECVEWLDASGEQHQTSEAGDVLWYVFALWIVGLCSEARRRLFLKFRMADIQGAGHGERFRPHLHIDASHAETLASLIASMPLYATPREAVPDFVGTSDSLLRFARANLVSRCGRLAGSVKKFARGDKGEASWETEFEARVLSDIRELIFYLLLGQASRGASSSFGEVLESVLYTNIVKIGRRCGACAVKGDGEER